MSDWCGGLVVDKDDVFGCSDYVTVAGAEELFDFGAVFSGEGFELRTAEGGDGLCLVVEHDDVTGFEDAFDGGDSAGEEAFSVFDGVHGAVVDADCSCGCAVEYPA